MNENKALRLASSDKHPQIHDKQAPSLPAQQVQPNQASYDIIKIKDETCLVCNNLFVAASGLHDRRPIVACINGDTICADCCKKCRQRRDAKCPACNDDLLKTLTVKDAAMVSVLDIALKSESFATGAFGKMFDGKWRNEGVEVEVVVKRINAKSEDEKEAFKRETNLTLGLNHQNVIKLFGITCVKQKKSGKRLGMVTEKAEHGSLDKWIGIGKIDRKQLTPIALGIVDGLKYVHSQNVIHRDIKPQNILMFGPKDAMIPKLADFGVAKLMERITVQTKVGSEFYRAPEIICHNPSGLTADIFSLSVMLFEMFNEQLISQSPELCRFLLRVQSGTIEKIPGSCKVPDPLLKVIKGGWNASPYERPSLEKYQSTLQG